MSFHMTGPQAVDNWDGSPQTLNQYEKLTMQNPPNGFAVLGYWNQATQNNDGSVLVGSQGTSTSHDAPALANAPSLLVNNWLSNPVTVTNMSAAPATPIGVEMYGPGIPGVDSGPLPVNQPVQLFPGATAQGQAQPGSMVLQLTASPMSTTIVAVIGGPIGAGGSNAYVYGLNMASPPPSPTPYTKTTSGSTLTTDTFNWGSATIFVANLSSANAGAVQVRLLRVG
jgi:hypothetical protein